MRDFARFLKACLGDANAQYELALQAMYEDPQKQNPRRAIYWAQRAMRNGAPRAFMLVVSILHALGEGHEAFKGLLLAWGLAAEKGEPAAQFALGHSHEHAWGVPRDLEKALYWYTKAAIGGYADAQSAVARLCKTGGETGGEGSP